VIEPVLIMPIVASTAMESRTQGRPGARPARRLDNVCEEGINADRRVGTVYRREDRNNPLL
jgi:hypothetical protein